MYYGRAHKQYDLLLIASTDATTPRAAFLAMRTKAIPHDLLRLISEWSPKSNQEFIANHTKTSSYLHGNQHFVDLYDQNISSIYGWNFTQRDAATFDLVLDLSFNQIRKVSDQMTVFGDLSSFRLNNNRIRSIDLRNTNIGVLSLWNNNISSNSFASNQIYFPHTVSRLSLFNNPIGSLANFEFPVGDIIFLSDCSITSLHNVCFNAKRVYLDDNPLQSVQNVTFMNIECLSLQNCNVSWSKFLTFDINFVGKASNITVRLDKTAWNIF